LHSTVTVLVPPATGVTTPTPLSMVVEVTFDVVQVRSTVEPRVTELAEAESVHTGAGVTGGVTVTVALQVTVPPGPTAVPV